MTRSTTWRSLLWVVVSAAATVLVVDRVLTARFGDVVLAEVHEGITGLAEGNPKAIAIGSSHARTFYEVNRQVIAQTGNTAEVAPIAVEYGKLSSYAWVLEHRVEPLLQEKGANGGPLRDRLRHMILLTEWWDSTPATDGRFRDGRWESLNLPSRAWTLRDFAGDALTDGLTDYNRNYLNSAFTRLAGDSVLVRDRGYFRLPRRMAGRPNVLTDDEYRQRVASWQAMLQDGDHGILDPVEMHAFDVILQFARRHRLELTVLLYPRKPATITEQARNTTLAHFAAAIAARCAAEQVRFLDWTVMPVLGDEHFLNDFDHVSAVGNERFARWALEHDLSFLLH